MTRASAATLILLLACASDPMEPRADAGPLPLGDAATDAAPEPDASSLDAQSPEPDATAADATVPGPDATVPPDAAPEPDAGSVDAGGPPPSCDALGAVYDAPLGVCVFRWLGTGCPAGAPLQWSDTADQHRIEGYLGALGGSGGVPLRKVSGSWQWVDGSPTPSIDWAEPPGSTDPFAYLTADGMRSYFRAYAYQLCTYEP